MQIFGGATLPFLLFIIHRISRNPAPWGSKWIIQNCWCRLFLLKRRTFCDRLILFLRKWRNLWPITIRQSFRLSVVSATIWNAIWRWIPITSRGRKPLKVSVRGSLTEDITKRCGRNIRSCLENFRWGFVSCIPGIRGCMLTDHVSWEKTYWSPKISFMGLDCFLERTPVTTELCSLKMSSGNSDWV